MNRVIYEDGSYQVVKVAWEYQNDKDWLITFPEYNETDTQTLNRLCDFLRKQHEIVASMAQGVTKHQERIDRLEDTILKLKTLITERNTRIEDLEHRIASIKHYALAYWDHYIVDICDGKKEAERE